MKVNEEDIQSQKRCIQGERLGYSSIKPQPSQFNTDEVDI